MLNFVDKNKKFLNKYEKKDNAFSPSGTGFLKNVKYVKDAETGELVAVKGKSTNLQQMMEVDAKQNNIKSLLLQADAGKIERKTVIAYDDELIPHDKVQARAITNKTMSLWDKNPLIRSIYPNKSDFVKALYSNVDIVGQIKSYHDKEVAGIDALLKSENGIKKEVKTDEVKEK